MEELAAALGATLDGKQLVFSAHGCDWKLRYELLSTHTIFTLSTSTDPLPHAQIFRRRTSLWRAYFSAQGEGHHVGDRAFLRAAQVTSDFTEETVRRLLTPEVRAAALVVFGFGLNKLAFSGSQLSVSALDVDPKLLEVERFKALLAATAALREDLPLLPAELAVLPSYSKRRWWVGALSLSLFPSLALATLYVTGPRWLTVDRLPTGYAALAGMVVGLLTDPLRRLLQRSFGDPRSIYQKFAWLSGMMVLFVSLFLAINGVRDDSPRVEHIVKVIETRHSDITDQARVESWRPGGGSEWVPISYTTKDRLKPGDLLHVTTSAGRLSYEWVREAY